MSGMCVWKIQVVSKKRFASTGAFVVPSGENVEFTKATKKALSWIVESRAGYHGIKDLMYGR